MILRVVTSSIKNSNQGSQCQFEIASFDLFLAKTYQDELTPNRNFSILYIGVFDESFTKLK